MSTRPAAGGGAWFDVATGAVQFAKRGVRRRPGFGLTYASACGRYELYKSDQVGGVPVKPPRWLAISKSTRKILSRHRTRPAAIAACIAHARKTETKV